MIYLDNSATTPLCDGAKNGMLEAIERFGNPSSRHFVGQEAAKLKSDAEKAVLDALRARPDRYALFFTSGGTEANNLAIFGAAHAKRHRNPKIIITDSEHPCIDEPCSRLEGEGFKIVRVPTLGGKIDEEYFLSAVDENTVLVSLMTVNNETGALYRTKPLFEAAREKNPAVLCHTDGVQAFLKVPFGPTSTGADLLTVSSHKIHGPKGCGALVVQREILKRKALLPQICGGGQQDGMRSGTENMIGIAGFGGAVREKAAAFDRDRARMAQLRDYLLSNLPGEIKPNLPPECAPHILSITLPSIKSETALNFLSGRGICVSAGSACANNGRHKSGVLAAFGLSDREIDSTLRVSLSAENTEAELDLFLSALREGLSSLVRFK